MKRKIGNRCRKSSNPTVFVFLPIRKTTKLNAKGMSWWKRGEFYRRDLLRYHIGPFNNYVGKMRGEGGQKMSVFVHAHGIRSVSNGTEQSNFSGQRDKGQKFLHCPRKKGQRDIFSEITLVQLDK